MESLAYLQAAVTYTEPQEMTVAPSLRSIAQPLAHLDRATWQRFSGKAATRVLAIACSMAVLGLASGAWAIPLRLGDRGPEVSALQTQLTNANFSTGGIDGVFGLQTQSALIEFQRSRGLAADGIFGTATEAVLFGQTGGNVLTDTLGSVPVSATAGALRIGSRSPGVEDLQKALARQARRDPRFDPGPVDGIFGSQTEAAVIAFQTANGLGVDGVAGSQTLSALGLDPAEVFAKSGGGSGISRNRNRYVVVVPGSGESLQASVNRALRELNPTFPLARGDSSRRGSFINAGAYDKRSAAESVSEWLRYRGFDARVDYD